MPRDAFMFHVDDFRHTSEKNSIKFQFVQLFLQYMYVDHLFWENDSHS